METSKILYKNIEQGETEWIFYLEKGETRWILRSLLKLKVLEKSRHFSLHVFTFRDSKYLSKILHPISCTSLIQLKAAYYINSANLNQKNKNYKTETNSN